ncbi:MAG: hypothetical protein IPO27_13540 [Bacteroidetes bacterium]|nr:hypothetical protein [Bacteroidota bacterium]
MTIHFKRTNYSNFLSEYLGPDIGSIDAEENDTTFNLTDNNYIAKWNLIAKTPKFVVLEVHSDYAFLVTLTYDKKN